VPESEKGPAMYTSELTEVADHVEAEEASSDEQTSGSSAFQCRTSSQNTNNAGVIRPRAHSGYVMTGGGMVNNYRNWDKKSAFEEMYPHNGAFQCDTGFGAGKLTCYTTSCKFSRGLTCITRASTRKKGSGTATATLPAGYTVTGGGVYNHYRHWNKKAAFEESIPVGNNQWRGDMGFGDGDFTVYARGCKAGTGYKMQCVTKTGHANQNYASTPSCPSGYQLTGCGINNQYRHWNKLSGFEASQPNGNKCTCDSGFGTGKNQCYARCCRVIVDHAERNQKARKAQERSGKGRERSGKTRERTKKHHAQKAAKKDKHEKRTKKHQESERERTKKVRALAAYKAQERKEKRDAGDAYSSSSGHKKGTGSWGASGTPGVRKWYTHGVVSSDAYFNKRGHYFLGPNRRRIGAGFGRRRRTKFNGKLTPKMIKQATRGKPILKAGLLKKVRSKGPFTAYEKKTLITTKAGLHPRVDSSGRFVTRINKNILGKEASLLPRVKAKKKFKYHYRIKTVIMKKP